MAKKMITKQKLKDMMDGRIFNTGTGTFPEVIDREIRWIAKRGDSYYDWTIYYGLVSWSTERIAREGSKMFTGSVIKRLVPCDNQAFGLYRFRATKNR